ncbi:hypothetical protein GCM10010967_54380 [Dyadobacter beijingensis]|uniref:RNA polymerase sigma factor, sigma-70 family n=1 Tax=Dyadobacter beijingensis TaxID=365489 RepID=A0ABQ2IKD4_9BACT|nr:sigma-70 family RNA polymerase sigma factor [Dyadobacter beijingensis]GGN11578.1 hypothetical protein GCM10010967_54380 [Dyadobacter beijingensis]
MTPRDSCKRYRDSELTFYEELLHEKHEAFTYLYRQTYQQCIPYVLKRGGDQEQAEDLLHDCLAIFVGKIRDGSYVYQENTRITTYFQSIYINQWKKNLSLLTRRAETSLDGHLPLDEDGNTAVEADLAQMAAYDDGERDWIFRKLDRAFRLLAEDCRKMLHWFYVEERSLREIAADLGMTEQSAAVKRFKCARYLKEKFHL